MNSIISGNMNIKNIKKIGVVTARFNRPVTKKLETGCVDKFLELGLSPDQIAQVQVPGAVEVPLAVKALLESGCDGVVAIGVVIQGESKHFDFVCNSVERGCTQLQLDFGKPVAFGVLTTNNGEQALARAGGAKGNKGAEAAEVVVEMINCIESIKSL